METGSRETILDELWRTSHFDVHSHFCGESGPVESVESYVGGWTQPEVLPPGTAAEQRQWTRERWNMKRAYWVYRAFPPALEELYGSKDRQEVTRAMNEVRSKGLLSAIKWMRERSNVEHIVVDSNYELPLSDDLILSTFRLEPSALCKDAFDLEQGVSELEAQIESLRRKGSVSCFKVPSAYSRTLCIEDPSPFRVRKAAAKDGAKRTPEEQKAVEDYLFRYFFRKAGKWSMPVEIHTGFGWAVGQRPLRLCEADPENLLPVLEDPEYRSTNFILFHGGYPFTSKMGYIAGAFPNVHVDFTCLCPESWRSLKRALHEWIDIVPMDRIVTGSDGSYEWLYFAAKYNRQALAEVLAEKVADELMDLDLAIEVGRRVLSTNARALFGITRL